MKERQGLVALLVVFNHWVYDIQLSVMPNGYVADVKYLVFKMCKFILYSSVFHDEPFSI